MGTPEPLGPASFHTFPEAYFDEIARGEGSADAMKLLWAGEYSRRLILLKALLDLVTAQPGLLGSLPPAGTVWRALEEMETEPASAAALREVLLHPQVGVWMSHTLRAIRSGRNHKFWPEVGQVYSLAFAVAVRSGRRCEALLPARDGYVLLPTLGLVRLPHMPRWSAVSGTTADGVTVLRADGFELKLPTDLTTDSENWWSLRRLRAYAGDHALELTLDDIDPFRDLADPVRPARLSDDDFRAWAGLVGEGWREVSKCMPSALAAMAAGLRSLAPLPSDDNGATRSASTGDGFGAVLSTRPHDAADMAVTLVHEFQHTKLGGLLHLNDLYADDNVARFYAPWREDPRPFGALFQGAYAFLGICAFWRSRHEITSHPMDQFEFVYSRRQTWKALRSLMRSRMTNDLGARFLRGMAERLRPWMSDPVLPRAASSSWWAVADHEVAWRARNLRPEPGQVVELADSWLCHDTPSHLSAPPRPAPAQSLSRRRFGLLRLFAGSPERFATIRATAYDDADVNLVGGDIDMAVRAYTARLRENVEDDDAWSGLALAAVKGQGMPWRSLLYRPELVKAVCHEVHNRLRQADPIAIAQWCERFKAA